MEGGTLDYGFGLLFRYGSDSDPDVGCDQSGHLVTYRNFVLAVNPTVCKSCTVGLNFVTDIPSILSK